jgi:hypothetical protein
LRKHHKNESSKLHISIGASPSTQDIDLVHELSLVKVALLYSDKATLCSPKALLLGMESLDTKSLKQKILFVERIIPVIKRELTIEDIQTLDTIKRIAWIRHPSRIEILRQEQLKRWFEDLWLSVRESFSKVVNKPDRNGLTEAFKSGNLKLKEIGTRGPDKMLDEFIEFVMNSIEKGDSHPLLDKTSSDIVRAGINEGLIKPQQRTIERGRQVQLVSDLFDRLPLFEAASVAEILDIRNYLDKYLVRFRSGMMKLSEQIRSASWDNDFPLDADDLVRKEIEPSIRDIEESVRDNKYLNSFVTKVVDKPLLISGSSLLGIAVSNLYELSGLVALSFGVGAAGLLLGSDAYHDWVKEKTQIERNYLYFYYELGKKIL